MGRIEFKLLPQGGVELIEKLNRAGYEAWFVGGCVRDLLLGNQPNDWDICTNALPNQTRQVLGDYRIHDTGIKHGTVLVLCQGAGYEITTYRTESGYSDHRRPDKVSFVADLASDLARRDFTVNAMAYHPRLGLVDEFDGRGDLERGIIRAVGDARARFGEDALRILRALRFAGRFRFVIAPETEQAIHACKDDLSYIAAERIFSELKGILVSPGAPELMMEFMDVFGAILPEVVPMFRFDQNNPHHDSDCWHHTARTVAGVPADPVLRLAALLHDIGKPDTVSTDKSGVFHFYGHNKRSRELTRQVLMRLRCDTETRLRVEELVAIHDMPLPKTLAGVRRFLAKMPPATALRLLVLRRADVLAQSPYQREEKLGQLDEFQKLLEEAVSQGDCWSMDKLAINGGDLIAAGVAPGPEVGRLLKKALSAVIDGQVENEKAALLRYLKLK